MATQTKAAVDTSDREFLVTRLFDAPRELVFDAFSDPVHISNWWGPRGFTTTTTKMDVNPGGIWRFCMHGPDGRDYENIVTYLEVVRPERLVYKHGGDIETEPVNFEVRITFEDRGGKTQMTWHMVFPSVAAFQHVIKEYRADEGLTQTLDRLGEHLAKK
jgi:uncharacterized protein YndB with AHSA1/START domain